MATRRVLLSLVLLSVVSLELHAGVFYASGAVSYGLADGGLGARNGSQSIDPNQGLTQMGLSLSDSFPDGNRVDSRAFANLAGGLIQTYTHAEYLDPSPFFFSNALAQGRLYDTLTFTLAPGYYPDGARVYVSGHIDGWLTDNGNSSGTRAEMDMYATFKGVEFLLSADTLSGSLLIDQDFVVSNRLITPGSTLTDTLQVQNVVIGSGLTTRAQVAPNDGAYATANFGATARFTAVRTPAGVTWTSASGVFAPSAEPAVIPEPSSLAVWLCAVASGIVLPLRRRQSRVAAHR